MFYLAQLTDVENEPKALYNLSASTVCLCLAALIPAENRYNWIEDLEELSDPEWVQAENFLTAAIKELTGGVVELQFLATNSTVQGVSDETALQFDTAVHNLSGQFNTTTSIWTVPSDGVYIVGGHIGFEALTPGITISMWAELNGSAIILVAQEQTNTIDWAYFSFQQPIYLQQGDEIEFWGFQSDGPTSKNTASIDACKVWAYKVG